MADVFFFDRDASGVTASHPRSVVLPVIVAPVPEEQVGDKFNAVRDPLVVLGCKEMPNKHFDFDSSFLGPQSAAAFQRLKTFLGLHRERDAQKRFPPSAVFGHADPTGQPGYNRMLSGRRASAVYGVLTRDTALWEALFSPGFQGDVWGDKAIQTMLSISLSTLQPSGLPEAPFYLGEIDGAKTAATRKQTEQAISAWRTARGLGKGTTLGAAQRKVLFAEYMDALCTPEFKLAKTDFIAKGQGGAALKGDVMGCGEFNPRFLLTAKAVKEAEIHPEQREARNESYAVNRRVIVYVFKHGTEIDPARWPCPAARSEDTGPCSKRFWSDGEKRQKEAEDERTFGDDMTHLKADDQGQVEEIPIDRTGNTMACRFYHGFARYSPCEVKPKEWVVRFIVPGFNGTQRLLKNRRFVAILGESASSPELRGSTDEFGVVRLPVFSDKTKMTVRLDAASDLAPGDPPPDGDPADEARFLSVVLDGGALEFRDPDNDLAIKQRLYNLGFGEHAPAKWDQREFDRAMAAFRRRNKMEKASDAEVRDRIISGHDLAGVPDEPKEDDGPLTDASAPD
jgi:hypothetical protein